MFNIILFFDTKQEINISLFIDIWLFEYFF